MAWQSLQDFARCADLSRTKSRQLRITSLSIGADAQHFLKSQPAEWNDWHLNQEVKRENLVACSEPRNQSGCRNPYGLTTGTNQTAKKRQSPTQSVDAGKKYDQRASQHESHRKKTPVRMRRLFSAHRLERGVVHEEPADPHPYSKTGLPLKKRRPSLLSSQTRKRNRK